MLDCRGRRGGERVVNRLRFLLVMLVALAGGSSISRAQQPTSPSQIPLAPPALNGSIESTGSQYRLNLTNTDASRGFQGVAKISLGNLTEQNEAGKVDIALAPEESRIFPLTALTAYGDQYTLRIYNQNGTLVFFKAGPIKRALDGGPTAAVSPAPVMSPPPAAISTPPNESEVKVQARLAGGESDTAPFILAFEVASPRPLLNAVFSVNSKGLQQKKAVNVQGRVNVEFKLPDDFSDRKVPYMLTDASGRVVAKGEADLDKLLTDDYISVAEVKPDRPAYAPGETARMAVTMQGGAQRSYRLEVTVRDGRGNIFFRDTRKGAGNGQALQEFAIDLPRETKGPITFEFKLFEAETGTLFDSGEREIPLTGGGESLGT